MEVAETRGQFSSYRWVVIGIWMVSSVSGFMVVSTFGILLPEITAELGLSPTQQGVLGSAAFWGNLTLAVPLSWLFSRFSPKTLTTVTMVFSAVFIFVQASAPLFGVLLFGRLAFGFSVIARQPAQAILMQQWFPPREFVTVNAVGNTMFGLVVGGGVATAPFILSSLGNDWRMTLGVFGGLLALETVLWIALGRENSGAAASRRSEPLDINIIRRAFSYRDLWITGFGFLGATLAFFAFISFFPTMALENYSIPLRWSGSLLALGIVMGGASGLVVGYVATLTRQDKLLLGMLGALMAYTFAAMPLTGSVPLLLLFNFLNGVAWGFWPILYTVPFHLQGIRPREVAVAVGFIAMMVSLGSTLGPLITGLLQEHFGDLRLALLCVSVAPMTLTTAGILLKQGSSPNE